MMAIGAVKRRGTSDRYEERRNHRIVPMRNTGRPTRISVSHKPASHPHSNV